MKDLNRMRDQSFAARFSMIIAASTLLSISCAHTNGASDTGAGTSHPAGYARRSEHVITMDPKADPLTRLEHELTTVQSDRVIVSTALLRGLVKNERIQQTQCKNISGQLEAIKNIDVQETTGEAKE